VRSITDAGLLRSPLVRTVGYAAGQTYAIIRGRKAITPDTALRLARPFGMEAQFWLNLQSDVDLYRAMHSPGATDIRKLRRVPAIAVIAARVICERNGPTKS
jgi:addiction module HigA family antidote